MPLDEKNIGTLTPVMLFDQNMLLSLYEEQPEERERLTALLKLRAKELSVQKEFESVIRAYNSADKALADEHKRSFARKNAAINLDFDATGKPLATVENFVQVLHGDPAFKGLQYNELTYSPEQLRGATAERWTDVDDAQTRRYIERFYRFHSQPKCDDALRIVFSENRYHPIRRIIDALEWDGKPRITTFLHRWMKCDDTPYTREVSRLIFAGGINRLYNPGCKFDDMPVLIGTKQGEGKSTLIRWLAMKDEFFAEITQFEGNVAIEQLSGAWICEVSELLAMTRTKEQEAVKSYLTRIKDHYREPYARRSDDRPRQCIFIGTTNKEQFLTDKTGNRRFYPVKVNSSGYDIFDHEEECRAEILQCWAEAKALYDEGKLPAFADRTLYEVIRAQQAQSVEDDWRVGMIESYLNVKDIDEVCVLDLWQNALNYGQYSKPDKKDSTEISLIMQNFPEWEKQKKRKRVGTYGVQMCWKRRSLPDGFEEVGADDDPLMSDL